MLRVKNLLKGTNESRVALPPNGKPLHAMFNYSSGITCNTVSNCDT